MKLTNNIISELGRGKNKRAWTKIGLALIAVASLVGILWGAYSKEDLGVWGDPDKYTADQRKNIRMYGEPCPGCGMG